MRSLTRKVCAGVIQMESLGQCQFVFTNADPPEILQSFKTILHHAKPHSPNFFNVSAIFFENSGNSGAASSSVSSSSNLVSSPTKLVPDELPTGVHSLNQINFTLKSRADDHKSLIYLWQNEEIFLQITQHFGRDRQHERLDAVLAKVFIPIVIRTAH